MQDKNDFITRDLMPIADGFTGDYDWDAIADEAGEYDAERGWHLRESIAADVDDTGFSDEFNDILMRHDLTDPDNWHAIRCILLDSDDDRSLYRASFDIDGDAFDIAVMAFADGRGDVCTTSDWQGSQPKSLAECDGYDWVYGYEWVNDPSTPAEARATVHAITDELE